MHNPPTHAHSPAHDLQNCGLCNQARHTVVTLLPIVGRPLYPPQPPHRFGQPHGPDASACSCLTWRTHGLQVEHAWRTGMGERGVRKEEGWGQGISKVQRFEGRRQCCERTREAGNILEQTIHDESRTHVVGLPSLDSSSEEEVEKDMRADWTPGERCKDCCAGARYALIHRPSRSVLHIGSILLPSC